MPHNAAPDATRLLTVTPGNVRQNHLYVRGLYDFFPPRLHRSVAEINER